MTKAQGMKIGLALNAIACGLPDTAYNNVKGFLTEIEKIVIDEREHPQIEIEDKTYRLENPVLKSVSGYGDVVIGGWKEVEE